jgi:uncharacterized protein (DUF302 family)
MIKSLNVRHVTLSTKRSFAEVVNAFEQNVGTLENTGWSAVSSGSKSVADFEGRTKQTLGPSGFTRFLTLDHGKWLTFLGQPAKFIQYIIGNPLIAITMLRHDIEAGLDVPVRLAIYEHPDGETRVVYNTPSSLMSSIDNAKLKAAAEKLDTKLLELAEKITGVKP